MRDVRSSPREDSTVPHRCPHRTRLAVAAALAACAVGVAGHPAPGPTRAGGVLRQRGDAPPTAEREVQPDRIGAAAADADELGFVLAGALGGRVLDLATHGARIAALIGNRLWLLEATDDGPKPVAQSAPLPGEPQAVAFDPGGTVAYVMAGTAGVLVLDAVAAGTPVVAVLPQAPLAPSTLGGTTVEGDVDVAGDTLYALFDHRLVVSDIARPDRPLELGSVTLDGTPRAVAATPWGAVTAGAGGAGGELLSVVQAVDRRRPVVVGRTEVSISFWRHMAADAHQALLAGASKSVLVDLTEPTVPRVTDLALQLNAVALLPQPGSRAVALVMGVPGSREALPALAWMDVGSAPPIFTSRAPLDHDQGQLALLAGGERAVLSSDAHVAVYRPTGRQAEVVGQPWPILGPVDDAGLVGVDRVAALANGALSVVRTSDGEVTATIAGAKPWDRLAVAGRWAVAAHNPREVFGFDSVTLTAIDLTRPDAPHAFDPITVPQMINAPFGGDGWFGTVASDAVHLWPVGEGIGPSQTIRRTVDDALIDHGVLYTASITEIVAYDLPDVVHPHPVLTFAASEAGPGSRRLLDVADRWLLANAGGNGVHAYRLGADHRAIPVPLQLDRALGRDAVIGGDRAFVLFRASTTEPNRVLAFDLTTGRRLGGMPVDWSTRDLASVFRRDGRDALLTADGWRGLLTYGITDGPAPSPTPLPTATEPPAPTTPAPAASRLFMPFAARTLSSTHAPVTFRPVARLGGMARAVRLDVDTAWLSEGRDIVAVDVTAGRAPVEIGRTAACAPMVVGCGQLALGGGRLVVVDAARSVHVGGVRVVDVRDPAHPRPAGFVPLGARSHGRSFEIAAARPDVPRFVLVSELDGKTETLVIDAADADRPSVQNIVDLPGRPLRLLARDGLWYVLRDDAGPGFGATLDVLDVGADGRVTTVGSVALTRGLDHPVTGLVRGVPAAFDGPRLLFKPDVVGGGPLLIVDVSDPRRPRMATEIPFWTSVASTALDPVLGPQRVVDAVAPYGGMVAFTARNVRGVAIALGSGPSLDGKWASARIPADGVPSLSTTDFSYGVLPRLDVSADRVVVAGGRLGGLSVVTNLRLPEPSVRSLAGIGLAYAVAAPAGEDGALVSGGAAPDIVSRVDVGARTGGVQRSGSAVANRTDRLVLEVEEVPAVDVAVDGVRVWTADAARGMAGFDVAPNAVPIALPDSLRRASTAGRLGRLAVAADGPFLWTVDPRRGLLVWDTSDAGPPRTIWDIGTGGAPEDVVMAGERLLVADGPGGLAVFSRGGVVRPREVGRLRLPGSAIRVTTAPDPEGPTAWVALEERPGTPLPLGAVGGGRGATAIAGVDVSDPAMPRLLGVVQLDLQHVSDIVRTGGVLIVAGTLPEAPNVERAVDGRAPTAALVAVDADRNAPTVIGRWRSDAFEPDYPSVTVLGDGRVAVAAGEDGIRVFDVR